MKCKHKTDGPKPSSAGKEALRLRVVHLTQEGASPETLATTLDINPRTIYTRLATYHDGGDEALKTQPKPGRPPKLNGPQWSHVASIIREKNPLQLKFPFALWTLEMVRERIRREFNVRLSTVSVGRILHRVGLTRQHPLRRAIEPNPVLVERWRNTDRPAIQREPKACNALMLFGDEAGIRSDDHRVTTWGQQGRTPIVPRTGARFSVHMLCAVSAQCDLRLMVHVGTATAATVCAFLERLVTGMDRPIVLTVDGHRIHRAKTVQHLMTRLDGKLKLFFLPADAPQLNPDEWLWNTVKRRVAKTFITTREQLIASARAVLHSLQRTPAKIIGFFRDPDCCYAAA